MGLSWKETVADLGGLRTGKSSEFSFHYEWNSQCPEKSPGSVYNGGGRMSESDFTIWSTRVASKARSSRFGEVNDEGRERPKD